MKKIAIDYLSKGVNVLPLKEDKSPNIGSWAKYQQIKFDNWDSEFKKIGLICGEISKGVEVIDVDCKYDLDGNLMESFKRYIDFNNKELWGKLVVQKTVSNGFHLIYRCKQIEGNKKLASRKALDTETGEKVKVLIETRGEGGYIVVAPSEGYEFIQNDLSNIPEITASEREAIFCSARALNQINNEVYEPPKKQVEWIDNGLKPWEDYDNRGNALDLLFSHGWSEVFRKNDRVMLKRPGNTSAKTSGSYNTKLEMFKSWSTSTEFESEKGYTPSAIFAVLECNGNFKEAGKRLYELGYGERSELIEKKKQTIEEENDFSFISNEIDETNYLHDFYTGKLQKGLSTGFDELDKYFLWKEGNLVINNGHMNVGKSTILWYLIALNNILHKWKWIIYSSENREASVRRRMIEFRFGKDYNKLTQMQVNEGKRWAYDNFVIIKSDTIEDYESIIQKCTKLMRLKPFKGLLIDPYNSLDVPMSSKSHEFHYKATTAFRIFGKKFDCTTVINTHAVTEALRKLDRDGYPVAPMAADTEGGGKFANRADDFVTFHRITQDPINKTQMQIHVRKIKETETGGEPTPLAEPVKLRMANNNDWFGFYDSNNNCPMQNIFNTTLKQPELPIPDTQGLEPVDFDNYNPDDDMIPF